MTAREFITKILADKYNLDLPLFICTNDSSCGIVDINSAASSYNDGIYLEPAQELERPVS